MLAVVPTLVKELGLLPHGDTLVGIVNEDVVYLSHGAFGLALGHVPYLPHFMTDPYQHLAFLYPPLTLLLAMPPVLAGHHYLLAFSLEVLALILLGTVALGAAVRRSGRRAPVGVVTAALLLAAGPIVMTRFDGLQGLLVAGSALALIRRHNLVAVALVALAVLIKETAVLAAVPVILWCLFPEPGAGVGLGQRLKELGLGLAPALLIFAFFLVWSHGAEVTSSLDSVHRGLEVESVPASVAILLGHFFPARSYLGSISSWQLASPIAAPLAASFIAVGGLTVVVAAALFARQHRHPATAVAGCVAVGLCATPVLSPQYLLDLLPALALAACLELPARRGAQLVLLGLVMALLTQAEFPTLFMLVAHLQPVGVILVAVRNLLLLATAFLLLKWGADRDRLAPGRMAAVPAAPD